MARICLHVRMDLLSDAIFGSGGSVPGGEDIALRLAPDGWPLLSGATLKGLLLESTEQMLCWTKAPFPEQTLRELFGEGNWHGFSTRRRVLPGDLLPENRTGSPETLFALRTFTQLEDGMVKDGSLRTAACLKEGASFCGILLCEEEDADLLQNALRGIKWAGMLRSRGFGRVRFTVTERTPVAAPVKVAPGHWLHYRLLLKTPLSAPCFHGSAVEASADGNVTLNNSPTRRFLPGSAVRGLVANALAAQNPQWFEAHKTELLGDKTRFLDALPPAEGQPVIPSPMGFYQDKAKTRCYSVLTRDVMPGDKRAGLGDFCRIEGNVMTPFSPAVEQSARIRRGIGKEKKLFTVERLSAGTVLDGYIRMENADLAPEISTAFSGMVAVGADRYAGSGLCEVRCVETVPAPAWESLGYGAGDTVPDTVYMLLLTPMTMTRQGEACGLDARRLADLLQVEKVEVERCATSLERHTGYNRQWGCRLPEYPVYRSGSVFRLHCTPAPDQKVLAALQERGIGAARGEGYGQVLFLRDYEQLTLAPAADGQIPARDTPADRWRRARCRWLLETKVPEGLSLSQLGSLQACCEQELQRGTAADAGPVLAYLEHNRQERGAFHGARFEKMTRTVTDLLQKPIRETLCRDGLSPELQASDCPDTTQAKLQLLCDWLDLNRKEEMAR